MGMSGTTPRKRYVLRSLAIVLLLFAGAAFLLEPHDFVIRSFGVLAILGGVQLTRVSRAQSLVSKPVELAGSNGPGRVMWSVAIGLLVLAAVSLWFLYTDALHGARAVWPVYLFAGVGLACACVWSYIAAQFVSRDK